MGERRATLLSLGVSVPLHLLLIACAPEPPPEVVFGTEATCWDALRSDLDAAPPAVCPPPDDWTPTPDSERLVAVQIVPDLTRDGRPDAIFTFAAAGVSGGREMRAERVVPGPLRWLQDPAGAAIAELRFPEDAVGIVSTGDLDGDGRTDLLVEHSSPCGTTRHAALAPLDGVVRFWEGPLYDGDPIDVDGDGALEQQRSVGGTVEIRAAGVAGWADAPCLVIAPSCHAPSPVGFDGPTTAAPRGELGSSSAGELARSWPDLDGDGERELWLGGAGGSCGGFVFSAAVTGQYDPNADPDAAPRIDPLPVVDDQSGDGLADVSNGDEVLLGPFTFLDGEARPTEVRIPAVDVAALGIDLDGDGFGEWITPEVGGAVDVFTGGPDGGVWTGERRWRVWVNSASDVEWVVEDGRAYILVVQANGELKTLDAGPAAVAAPR